jgi:hypothetical protein
VEGGGLDGFGDLDDVVGHGCEGEKRDGWLAGWLNYGMLLLLCNNEDEEEDEDEDSDDDHDASGDVGSCDSKKEQTPRLPLCPLFLHNFFYNPSSLPIDLLSTSIPYLRRYNGSCKRLPASLPGESLAGYVSLTRVLWRLHANRYDSPDIQGVG